MKCNCYTQQASPLPQEAAAPQPPPSIFHPTPGARTVACENYRSLQERDMIMMTTCTNRGCGKDFTDSQNGEDSCVYHPGGPVFHEGLKGWSCCKKRVTNFDDFLSLPGCTTGRHSNEKKSVPAFGGQRAVVEEPAFAPDNDVEEKESMVRSVKGAQRKIVETVELPESDPPGAAIPQGSQCQRNGCHVVFKGEQDRTSECRHHPGSPVFHEGSKGWSCCKEKVLEFEAFLRIRGCTIGKHVFIPPPRRPSVSSLSGKSVRKDWYQTPTTVVVAVFVKKCDKNKTSVTFEENRVELHMETLSGDKIKTSFRTWGTLQKDQCAFEILGTKVELTLKKASGVSWPCLEGLGAD